MKPIPISAAERIAKEFGYDQVVIIARKVGDSPNPHGEHCTTYGINKAHCGVAARIGDFLKHKVMGWVKDDQAGGAGGDWATKVNADPQYQPEPWAGEGPPPVGHTCQVAPHNTLWGFSVATTYVCTILAYHGEFVWLDIGLPGVPVATRIDKVDFWAIRTPEQIAEDEKKARVAELANLIEVSGWESPEILAAYLDSHGYSKKVSP